MSANGFSSRISSLNESATLKINALVTKLKQEGHSIYNLTAGEPDFEPHPATKEAVRKALEQNWSKYTPTPGLPELRELVAQKTNRQQSSLNIPWSAQEVVVSNGGKQALFNAILALVENGDEVIVPAPYWLSYPEMIKAAGGTMVSITAGLDQNYKITPKQLEMALTAKTKIFIINSPSNPTGAMYTKEELYSLGEVLKKWPHVWVISDEIYDQIEFEPESWHSFLNVNPHLRDRTVTVNGLSKSGAMTGWRVGWSVANKKLTQILVCLQGHSTSGICSLSQAAAIAALKLDPTWFEEHRRQYLHRRNLALETLKASAKIKVYEPAGAFYLFIDVSGVLKPNEDANGIAERILQEAQVAVVSGVDFGAPQHVRISFATSEENLVKACERLVHFFNSAH